MNYLTDEAVNTGKGSNAIISMIHHFLATHSLGESKLELHADNCSGQNKNRYVLCYLAWRVLAGLNTDIELSFLRVGHTKFSPDWCFGLLKQTFRRTRVGCLEDIVKVVETSSQVNHAQLVGKQDGTVIVLTYSWAEYLPPFFKANPFKGIKKLHHIRFCCAHPGKCFVKEDNLSEEKTLSIIGTQWTSWSPSPQDLPPVIPPEGLSLARRKYLYEKIREFCPPDCQDLVCPNPDVDTASPASPPSSPSSPAPSDSSPASSPIHSTPQSLTPSPASSPSHAQAQSLTPSPVAVAPNCPTSLSGRVIITCIGHRPPASKRARINDKQ